LNIECSVDALTVGVSTQHDDHLKFLYEGNSKFAVLPTYAVIPSMAAILQFFLSGNIKGFQFNPAMVIIIFIYNVVSLHILCEAFYLCILSH